MDSSGSKMIKSSNSLIRGLSIKIEDEKKVDVDKEKQREQLQQWLKGKYAKQCFNKKMSGFYIDLHNCQRNCQKSIMRSTNLIQTFFPKKLSIPSLSKKSNSLSRHLSQRNLKSKSNGLSIIFSNKNKGNAGANINSNNNDKEKEKEKERNIKSQLKRTSPLIKNQSEISTRNIPNPFLTGMNKVKYSTQSSKCTKLPGKSQSHSQTQRTSNSENRRKKYKVSYDINWTKREGFYEPKSSERQNSNYSYQKQVITNELLVLLDNISKFRLSYLDKLLSVVMNINQKYIWKLNIIIEETCGLIMEIVHLILLHFTNYVSELSNQQIEYPSTRLNESIVYDEYNELKVNINAFIELSEFLKEANEMYVGISSQMTSLVLTSDKMDLAKHYLSRCRYNVSKLIFTSKCYFNNSSFDEGQYAQYRYEINRTEKKLNKVVSNNIDNDNDDAECYKKELKDANERQRERITSKRDRDCGVEKANQLTFLLNIKSNKGKEDNYLKKYIKPKEKHFDFDSKMMNKMLKYMSPEKQSEIMAEKLLKNYKTIKEKNTGTPLNKL